MFTAEDIRVSLGGRTVLGGVDFSAADGQVTAIVGPNGSGKTTLLRAMTGELGYSGAVRLEGGDVASLKPWQLATRRGVLPQSTRLAFPFTVLEVVRLGLSAGRDAGQYDLPHQALARVGLPGFEGRFYQELSGGEQQRTQLARVLVQVWDPAPEGRPSWLFLDEPVASLDIGHQLEVMQLVRDYANAGGGVIAVMHDINLTAMFADSVALMCDGLMVKQGAPEAVLTNDTLTTAYGCQLRVNTTPPTGKIFLLPHVAGSGNARAAVEKS
ncbi:MAG: heme ABC transporter ATP-binding protein [Pseudomonadota bacterium]